MLFRVLRLIVDHAYQPKERIHELHVEYEFEAKPKLLKKENTLNHPWPEWADFYIGPAKSLDEAGVAMASTLLQQFRHTLAVAFPNQTTSEVGNERANKVPGAFNS